MENEKCAFVLHSHFYVHREIIPVKIEARQERKIPNSRVLQLYEQELENIFSLTSMNFY